MLFVPQHLQMVSRRDDANITLSGVRRDTDGLGLQIRGAPQDLGLAAAPPPASWVIFPTSVSLHPTLLQSRLLCPMRTSGAPFGSPEETEKTQREADTTLGELPCRAGSEFKGTSEDHRPPRLT